MNLEKGQIILRTVSEPRKGWDKAFQQMHDHGDDKLHMNDVLKINEQNGDIDPIKQ